MNASCSVWCDPEKGRHTFVMWSDESDITLVRSAALRGPDGSGRPWLNDGSGPYSCARSHSGDLYQYRHLTVDVAAEPGEPPPEVRSFFGRECKLYAYLTTIEVVSDRVLT